MVRMRELGLFLAVFVCAVFCGDCSREEIPSKILGVWTTEVPPYTDATMVIADTYITFKNGDSVSEHRIAAFEKTKDQNGVVYTIFYESEGGKASLAFFLMQIGEFEEGEYSLIFKNQKNLLWTKTAH